MMKVSIIVPVYNVEKYLKQCIDSLVVQSFTDFEIILVDDGSTDNSRHICDDYAKLDKRIKVIHKANGGVSSARNTGIEVALGKYIMFVDSDDYIDTDMVSVLFSEMEYNEADMVVCGFNVVLAGNIKNIYYENAIYNNKQDIAEFFSLLEGRTNSTCNKMYKTSLITKYFDSRFSQGEDLLFNLDYIRGCNSLIVIDRCFYFYRRENTNSLSQSYNEKSFEISEYLNEQLHDYLYEVAKDKINCDAINMYFFKDTISYLTGLINLSDENIGFKLKRIRDLFGNERLLRTMANLGEVSPKYIIIRKLIEHHMTITVFIFIKLWSFPRRINIFSKLYSRY